MQNEMMKLERSYVFNSVGRKGKGRPSFVCVFHFGWVCLFGDALLPYCLEWVHYSTDIYRETQVIYPSLDWPTGVTWLVMFTQCLKWTVCAKYMYFTYVNPPACEGRVVI